MIIFSLCILAQEFPHVALFTPSQKELKQNNSEDNYLKGWISSGRTILQINKWAFLNEVKKKRQKIIRKKQVWLSK